MKNKGVYLRAFYLRLFYGGKNDWKRETLATLRDAWAKSIAVIPNTEYRCETVFALYFTGG